MFQMAIIVFVGSILVGLLGRNRKFGFWGYFFASILLSPIIGLLLVVASDKRKPSTFESSANSGGI